jgi:hypothetical protein
MVAFDGRRRPDVSKVDMYLDDRISELEASEEARAADKDRDVEITIVKEKAK